MARKVGKKKRFLQRARKSMEERGTVGAFGKATPKKIAAGLRKGGVQAKRAAFAKAMKTIARKRRARKGRGRKRA
jgi:hypothetical protein